MDTSQTLCRRRMESDTQRDQGLEKLKFKTTHLTMPLSVNSLKSTCSVVVLSPLSMHGSSRKAEKALEQGRGEGLTVSTRLHLTNNL